MYANLGNTYGKSDVSFFLRTERHCTVLKCKLGNLSEVSFPEQVHGLELLGSLVPRPVRAIRVTRGGLEPSAIARYPRRIFPTSLTGDVTSEIAEDDWERGWSPGSSRYWKTRNCSAFRAVPKIFHYEARPIVHVDIILISS